MSYPFIVAAHYLDKEKIEVLLVFLQLRGNTFSSNVTWPWYITLWLQIRRVAKTGYWRWSAMHRQYSHKKWAELYPRVLVAVKFIELLIIDSIIQQKSHWLEKLLTSPESTQVDRIDSARDREYLRNWSQHFLVTKNIGFARKKPEWQGPLSSASRALQLMVSTIFVTWNITVFGRNKAPRQKRLSSSPRTFSWMKSTSFCDTKVYCPC